MAGYIGFWNKNYELYNRQYTALFYFAIEMEITIEQTMEFHE